MTDSSDDTVAQQSGCNDPVLDVQPGNEGQGTSQVCPYASEIIEILVGSAEKRYYAHKDVICTVSPFFRRCLDTEMREASTKIVKLPDDQPEAFEQVLKWVYCRGISKPHPEWDLDQERLEWNLDQAERLYQTYLLADKLCMEVLTNEIMDLVMDGHKETWSFACLILEVPECPLKQFLIAQLAWDLRDPEIWNEEDPAEQLRVFFVSGATDIVDVMKANGRLIADSQNGKVLVPPYDGCKCDYHKHVDSEKCKE